MTSDATNNAAERRAPALRRRLLSLLPLLCAALLLLSSVANEPAWDDLFFLSRPGPGAGLHPMQLFTLPFWQQSAFVNTPLVDFWRPLSSVLLWLTGYMTGAHPAAFRLLAILCAALAAAGVGRLAARTAGPGEGRSIGIAAASLYAIHPLSVEVTCMAVNISDHLAIACLCGATITVLKMREQNAGALPYAVLFLLCAAACTAKEFGVMCALLPLFLLPGRRPAASVPLFRRRMVFTTVACALPALLYLTGRHVVMAAAGGPSIGDVASLDAPLAPLAGLGIGLLQIPLPVLRGAHFYLPSDGPVPLIAGLATAAGLAGLVVHLVRRRTEGGPATGIAVAILLALPSLLVVPAVGDTHRFPLRYFAVSLAAVLALSLPLVGERWRRPGKKLFAPVFVLLALLSMVRMGEWRTHLSFVRAEAEIHQTSAFEQLNYGSALLALRRFDEARVVLDLARRGDGIDEPASRSRLLSCDAELAAHADGDPARASSLIRQAMALQPSDLRHVLDLADYRAMAGHPEESLAMLEEALASPRFTPHQKTALPDRIRFYQQRSRP